MAVLVGKQISSNSFKNEVADRLIFYMSSISIQMCAKT